MLKNCTCTGTIAKEWDYSASDLVWIHELLQQDLQHYSEYDLQLTSIWSCMMPFGLASTKTIFQCHCLHAYIFVDGWIVNIRHLQEFDNLPMAKSDCMIQSRLLLMILEHDIALQLRQQLQNE